MIIVEYTTCNLTNSRVELFTFSEQIIISLSSTSIDVVCFSQKIIVFKLLMAHLLEGFDAFCNYVMCLLDTAINAYLGDDLIFFNTIEISSSDFS